MIRRPPRSTLSSSSAASDVYKRQANSGGKPPRRGSRSVTFTHSAGDEESPHHFGSGQQQYSLQEFAPILDHNDVDENVTTSVIQISSGGVEMGVPDTSDSRVSKEGSGGQQYHHSHCRVAPLGPGTYNNTIMLPEGCKSTLLSTQRQKKGADDSWTPPCSLAGTVRSALYAPDSATTTLGQDNADNNHHTIPPLSNYYPLSSISKSKSQSSVMAVSSRRSGIMDMTAASSVVDNHEGVSSVMAVMPLTPSSSPRPTKH
eukprot:TRINITY_DN13052_c0_g1_i5.p1 TRINITY_DN13052_c0_g1~~TRINITY_DN13052_c0_g1_i5.p1  ORF type:complete len:259 (+),score=21.80 TRINITY_DN13052_c0_g1_i5:77-853(+)